MKKTKFLIDCGGIQMPKFLEERDKTLNKTKRLSTKKAKESWVKMIISRRYVPFWILAHRDYQVARIFDTMFDNSHLAKKDVENFGKCGKEIIFVLRM